jgi:uroporphyrinogen decarboxylase
MTSEERIIKTLRREPVDRVPSFEWIIDKAVINALTPGATEIDFIFEHDLDAICVDLNYKTEDIGGGRLRDEWGQIKSYTKEGHSFPIDGPITDPDALRNYRPPDPHDPARFKTLEDTLAKYGGKKAIIVHLNDVYSIPSRLMKYEDFLCEILDDPQFITDLVNMTVDVQLELAEECVKRGVKICYTGDDLAYINGPLMSPESFKSIFFEPMKRVIGGYKSLGLYVIKHTDGDIHSLIDMIIDTGIDCLDPIDRLAGMELADVKNRFGDRVAIKGNVDCAGVLVTGSMKDVEDDVKDCLRIGAPGYGYILSSSNSIHSSVRPENYKAMLETYHKYRNYPIQF